MLRGFASSKGFFEALGLGSYGVSAKALRAEATSAARVGAVRRPLLVVASDDDPIVPIASLPLDAMEANPHIVTAVTRHGGHMGYTAGLSPLQHSWVDNILVHYVRHWMQGGDGGDGGGDGDTPFASAEPRLRSRL